MRGVATLTACHVTPVRSCVMLGEPWQQREAADRRRGVLGLLVPPRMTGKPRG